MGFRSSHGAVRFWRDWNYLRGYQHTSADYLDTKIHQEVLQKYYNNLNENKIQQDLKDAEDLTNFFRTIKANVRNQKTNSELQNDLVYQLFFNILKHSISYSGDQGKIENFFRTPESNGAKYAASLQKQISHIQRAINVLNNAGSLQDAQSLVNNKSELTKQIRKEYFQRIQIGGKNTFNAAELNEYVQNSSMQKALNICGLATKKNYENKNTGEIYSLLNYQDKFVKIDSAFQSIDVTVFARMGATPYFQHILSLLSCATFSLKNYLSVFQRSKMVFLGDTNITKILLSVLPTLACVSEMEDGQFQSFITALFLRYFAKRGTRSTNQKAQQHVTMSQHFFHIQTVYELTGIGQHSKNNDANELNQYLRQGVKYLLVNQHGNGLGGDIKVFSTKALLLYLYRDMFEDGTVPNYGGIGEEKIKTARYTRVAGFENHFARLFMY